MLVHTKKPAWYNEGPDNLDELMDFDDMKIPQINDKAIYKIECSDTSKKENQLKIHTLREIESCLDVHIHNQEHTCDLSAFNKLLDIVGLRTNSGLDCEPKISKTTVKDDNIDSEKVNPSKNGNSTFNETKCTPAKNFNTYPKCYPSHLLNHTNLGNANAASANAFIYQNIDSFSNFESEAQGSQDNGYPYLGYDTEPGQSCENYDYNNQEYFCQNTLGFPINNYVKKVANGLLNPIELQNSGKSFGRQSLQPFLLQQLLRQQQIAKYSAMRFLNLRNSGLGFTFGFQSTRINTLGNSQNNNYNNASNDNNYNILFTQNDKLEQQEQNECMLVPTKDRVNRIESGEISTSILEPKSTEEFRSCSGEIAC
ncbi:unnamed protein product [Hymenolepis diminuta]|uniref:Uncharacterized protein n=1 Tax=Hymenolepis diminuta TaxID=6216 RepID=A0A0R3SAU9_HYMDI|nr:unnamed protein product [Hymenolepis diminuta]